VVLPTTEAVPSDQSSSHVPESHGLCQHDGPCVVRLCPVSLSTALTSRKWARMVPALPPLAAAAGGGGGVVAVVVGSAFEKAVSSALALAPAL
jgi:hypothetical protein